MATITQTSDPELWAKLCGMYYDTACPGYVVITPVIYRVQHSSVGNLEFVVEVNQDLLDSRSLSNSKATSYKKLDEGG